LAYIAKTQENLVPNPGFEEEKPRKPSRSFNVIHVPNQPLVKGWAVPTTGTADYYNSDKSTVYGSPIKKARSGQGRIGLIAKPKKMAEYSEYVTARLTKPLEEDKFYTVSMYYCIDRRCTWAAKTFGICFTNDYISYNASTPFPKMSQITSDNSTENMVADGWVELKKVYQAHGGEQYITIGCFDTQRSVPVTGRKKYEPVSKLDAKNHFNEYAYYYVDDVCVTEITDDPLCKTCCVTQPNSEKSYNNFVFMVDISSSMAEKGFLEEAKKNMVGFIDTLGKNDLISVVTFDGNSTVIAKKIPVAEKDSLTHLIGRIVTGSSTNIDKAVSTAYYVMDSAMIPQGNNRVILLSDAVFKLSSKSSNTIKTYYKKKEVIFTMIQFGNQYNEELEKVCKKTGGNYAHTKNEPMNAALRNQLTGESDFKNEYTKENKRASYFRVYKTGSLPPFLKE
jgi:hypothetical protein